MANGVPIYGLYPVELCLPFMSRDFLFDGPDPDVHILSSIKFLLYFSVLFKGQGTVVRAETRPLSTLQNLFLILEVYTHTSLEMGRTDLSKS